MKKLFYEVSSQFKPTHYLVMGRIRGVFEPMTFDPTSGSFCHVPTSDDSQDTDEVAEVYDKEAAIVLLGHHALNCKSDKELKLFPVYIQQPPQLYMIFAQHADDGNELPSPLCRGTNYPLTWAGAIADSQLPAPELFDFETAQELVEKQRRFQESLPNDDFTTPLYAMFIIPVNVSLSGQYGSPYLNTTAPAESVAEVIRRTANYCRSLNPEEEDEAWHMPASLGGAEIVPANTIESITSPENLVQ